MTDLNEREISDCLYQWHKEGAACRDLPGSACPYPGNTLAHAQHSSGWLTRDLQLALARANPRYRADQLRCGTITEEGIRGGYGFSASSPFVEATGE